MSNKPASVEVRMYNVGFGDCFLLTFRSHRGGRSKQFDTRRLLIDFGSTGRNSDGPGLRQVADQIVVDCSNDYHNDKTSKNFTTTPTLDAVVVTHRHRDHMAGFGGKTGEYLTSMVAPKLIVQPWTEDPKMADADMQHAASHPGAVQHVRSLSTAQMLTDSILSEILARQERDLARETDDEALFYGMKNLPFSDAKGFENSAAMNLSAVSGTDGLSNFDAITRLQDWAKKGAHEYLQSGDKTALEKVIPGLSVDVLGPTGPEFWDKLKSHGEKDELWERIQGLRKDVSTPDDADAFIEFDESQGPYGVPPLFDAKYQIHNDRQNRKDNVRWLIRHLDRLRGRQLLSFVRALDSHLNNTSLVLLLSFGGFRMLFPGDAEVASWQLISNRTDNTSNDAVVRRLQKVDLYKVGHHGSDNATPKLSLWSHLTDHRSNDHTLHCLLSTQWTKFKDIIPNASLYSTMRQSSNIQMVSTAPNNEPRRRRASDWKPQYKAISGKKTVMSYAQTFVVNLEE